MQAWIVTDEISADPETAFELGVEWGVISFKLRGFGTDRVPHFSPFQEARLRELLDKFEMQIDPVRHVGPSSSLLLLNDAWSGQQNRWAHVETH